MSAAASKLPAPTLADLSPGTSGLVGAVAGSGTARRRLLDLGLIPGTRVDVLRRSPLGDPTAYRIRGAVIALRSQEASLVTVEASPGNTGTRSWEETKTRGNCHEPVCSP